MQKARWSTAVAAAALLALPVVGSAQSQAPSPSSQQPPTSASPQTPATAAAPASGQVDANAAKTHLSEARDTLSQLTSLPEAAKLQGDARTKVAAIISDFNALITTQSDWRAAYAKVDADLNAALGSNADATQANQPVGTSGSTTPAPAAGAAAASGSAQIDPAIRAKLGEFRTHLKAFEQAAGGGNSASASDAAAPTSAAPMSAASTGAAQTGTTPPSVATGSTANPAQPGQPQPTGTSGVSPSSPTATMDPADRAKAESAVSASAPTATAAPNADAQKELDAISSILSKSRTGTLTKAQTAQLKKHVETLRALLAQR